LCANQKDERENLNILPFLLLAQKKSNKRKGQHEHCPSMPLQPHMPEWAVPMIPIGIRARPRADWSKLMIEEF
jgi:hypothetical protein